MCEEKITGHDWKSLAWHARLMAEAVEVYTNWTVF